MVSAEHAEEALTAWLAAITDQPAEDLAAHRDWWLARSGGRPWPVEVRPAKDGMNHELVRPWRDAAPG